MVGTIGYVTKEEIDNEQEVSLALGAKLPSSNLHHFT
jgi:hypothetical protein